MTDFKLNLWIQSLILLSLNLTALFLVNQKPSFFVSKWGIPQRPLETSLLVTNLQDSFEDTLETQMFEEVQEESIFV